MTAEGSETCAFYHLPGLEIVTSVEEALEKLQ